MLNKVYNEYHDDGDHGQEDGLVHPCYFVIF